MPRKKRLSEQMKQLVARRVGRLVASANPTPKKRSIYPQRSDHWEQTPRSEGRFASDRPTSKKAISFKIPEDLMEELQKVAGDRNSSVNLIVKDFVVRNFAQIVENQAQPD